MLLASVASIREMFGFDNMTDINEAITGALLSAEPYLAAQLETSFLLEVVVDTFFALEPGYIVQNHAQTEFKLSRGFVSTLQTITTGTTADFSGDITSLAEHTVLKPEKGVLANYRSWFDRQYVRATYLSGFPPASADADEVSYDLTVVPGWLQEAAKLYAQLQLNNHPSFEQTSITQDVKSIQQQLDVIVAAHRRYAPVALLPL